MNYYKHHIGDYARDTAHLSMLEDAAYRRMLDLYYASEKPLPALDALCRLIRARSKEERKAVEQILSEFFEQREDGWHQRRCDSELEAMQAKAGTNRDNGKKGGRPKKEPTDNPQKTQSVSEANPNQTLAISHKPLPITQEIKALSGKPDPDPPPKPAKPDHSSQSREVLDYLNQLTGRSYRPVPANLALIAARLKEGFSVDDLRGVVERKTEEWRGKPEMEQYLRPATLFNASKCAQYSGQVGQSNRIQVDA